jgi:hypothetical protein
MPEGRQWRKPLPPMKTVSALSGTCARTQNITLWLRYTADITRWKPLRGEVKPSGPGQHYRGDPRRRGRYHVPRDLDDAHGRETDRARHYITRREDWSGLCCWHYRRSQGCPDPPRRNPYYRNTEEWVAYRSGWRDEMARRRRSGPDC